MDSNTSCGDCEEIDVEISNAQEMTEFDFIIGCIEDILVDEEFQSLQTHFMEKHWEQFEDEEENKLIYMNIFSEYNNVIEQHIEEKLNHRIPGFCMRSFIDGLTDRRNELEGEVFEMLFTFSDFLAFKEMFLSYKAMKEGRTVDFSQDILITPLQIHE